ncbi:PP2C-domain-containing protein [Suhomyces tanzawaensis NRRL Y-17324]|uniref:protein-serine/threonine phosphatase n=1 Tax=Suhomyces tanzawaensis NRRL Y-17324 TaxID=984487 RepID=A0A1E4SK30_9ASCO|nr:PP2C-domain-containing protein [Suhomyces tanzawaensis NRRL Y-17324]ODV79866.1 PP2C-domain-containing protein [Suhomyces tanzawaensis NRRL Y-17324]
MGQILSQPITEKSSEKDGDKYLSYGLSSMQGWRINMEDAHATILNLQDEGSKEHAAFFGVYDGHGGEKAAIFTGEHLHDIVKSTQAYKNKDYINALKEGFLSCDQAILQDAGMKDDDSGCAATSAIITDKQIICGNAGDSRTIMSINGYAKALSYDHKPSNEGEKARICSAGGYVDMGRVNGNLALSRGIGDFEFKKNVDLPAEEQIVTCYPDVIQHDIDFEKDEFVVLACDGIWDCLTSQKCVECIRKKLSEGLELTEICEAVMDLCCAPTSDGSGIGCDNMSIVIVALLDYSKGETLDQWYEKIRGRIDAAEKDKNSPYGPISPEFNEIYKEMYGEHYDLDQQAQRYANEGSKSGNGASIFGRRGYDDDNEDLAEVNEEENGDLTAANGAISLQKLLSSNAITNENGVIYLDTSSAQSLLAHFGMSEEGEEGDSVHEGHIEEEEVEDESAEKSSDKEAK